MSATLETIATAPLTARRFRSLPRKSLASVRCFIAETSPYDVIETTALLSVFGATTVLLMGAFGVHIGAN